MGGGAGGGGDVGGGGDDVGGESGPGKRPMNLAWMRSIRDQCAVSGVPFFGKQNDKIRALPDDLLVRQFPAVR